MCLYFTQFGGCEKFLEVPYKETQDISVG
ncbi:hypothetical protein XCR1_3800002 [Xenorhabdus cabanillasii JM26]|uniref:Uncharacterized protein n=1 Tax=Xenorhabdus cabanillasii JM26 TaxID=1427517 RepID=W1J6T8_9GAMM|nr:hypothetical protein XCR1_3800002 [Xenorhabdus cabanillasii JM26]